MPTDAGPDVVVVGGGHNALVAATYLARAGLAVTVLERLDHLGGAAVSGRPFVGVDAHLSRYSYLVSLFPTELAADLGIDLQLRSRSTASYTPEVRGGVHMGLMIESRPGDATWESFAALTGSSAAARAWSAFYADVADFAQVLAPTYLQPLPSGSAVRDRLGARTGQGRAGQVWRDLVDQPIGTTIDQRFDDDLVRGVVATDALIGTFTDLGDPARLANRCFLYHLTGNATGEWRVPVGGMGAVTGALARRRPGRRRTPAHQCRCRPRRRGRPDRPGPLDRHAHRRRAPPRCPLDTRRARPGRTRPAPRSTVVGPVA